MYVGSVKIFHEICRCKQTITSMPKRFQQNFLLPARFTWHHAWWTFNKFQQYCILQVCPNTGL